jgi:hypothetical protein
MTSYSKASDPSNSPFNVSSKSQLFIDQILIRYMKNVFFTLHPAEKHPMNPLLKADKPWEGWRLEIYGTVLYDEDAGIFKMWYIGEVSEYFQNYTTLYATSKDGIIWIKPPVGTVPCQKLDQHNAVIKDCVIASVIKDKNDPDPAKRYKMLCWLMKPLGYYTMVSPDGLHWTRFSKEPICHGYDVITGYYDEQRKLYVAYVKIGTDVGEHNRRCFYLITSKDFINWTKPRLSFTPDLRDDTSSLARIEEIRPILDVPDNQELMRTEFYGIGLYPHESCILAFPWVFTINNNSRYGNQEGPSELQLAISRDLENWECPFRLPCVPRGRIGEWDCGFFVTSSRAIRVKNEIWLYYGGSNYSHGTPVIYCPKDTKRKTKFTGSIGLAKWKLDRFVSVDASSEGGALTTIPIIFKGSYLELNATTRKYGRIIVEILDVAGKKVLARSNPFEGDNLHHKVTWESKIDISRFAVKPITLRFHINSGSLYSFAFR